MRMSDITEFWSWFGLLWAMVIVLVMFVVVWARHHRRCRCSEIPIKARLNGLHCLACHRRGDCVCKKGRDLT